MEITIEIPDDCYGDYLDEDDNLIITPQPIADQASISAFLSPVPLISSVVASVDLDFL